MRLYPRKLLNVFSQIREDWEVNGRDWTQPGFRALAVNRLGRWLAINKGRNPFLLLLWRLDEAAFRYIRNHYGIELPHHTQVGQRVRILHQSGIVVHGAAVIGDDSVLHQNVTIGALNNERSQEVPKLGRDVHVACGAVILGPVTIGDGARIGPNCVVMTDVPAGATVFVNPPRMMLNMRRASEEQDRPSSVARSR